MTDTKFENEETQLVYCWLTQEEKDRRKLQVLAADVGENVKALAQQIEALVTDFSNPLSGHNSLYANLLQASFDKVHWQEIADTFLRESR